MALVPHKNFQLRQVLVDKEKLDTKLSQGTKR